MTNSQVFVYGDIVDDWPCDVDPVTGDPKTNGGVEHLVRFRGKEYLIITDWDRIVVFRPEEEATPWVFPH